MPPRPTGLAQADAQDDFLRARRRLALSRLRRRAAREPGDVDLILPVRRGRRRARAASASATSACRSIPLDSIVGTVDRPSGLRPPLPPDLVAGARALGADRGDDAPRRGAAADRRLPDRRRALRARRPPPRVGRPRARASSEIDAHVIEVVTRVGASRDADASPTCRSRATSASSASACRCRRRRARAIKPSDPWATAAWPRAIEAWALRAGQERGELLDREEVARELVRRRVRAASSRLLRDAGHARATAPRPTRTCASAPSATGSCARRSTRAARPPARRRGRRRSAGWLASAGCGRAPRLRPPPSPPLDRPRLRPERRRTGGSSPDAARAGGSPPPSPSSSARGARPRAPLARGRHVGRAGVGGQLGELVALRAALPSKLKYA